MHGCDSTVWGVKGSELFNDYEIENARNLTAMESTRHRFLNPAVGHNSITKQNCETIEKPLAHVRWLVVAPSI